LFLRMSIFRVSVLFSVFVFSSTDARRSDLVHPRHIAGLVNCLESGRTKALLVSGHQEVNTEARSLEAHQPWRCPPGSGARRHFETPGTLVAGYSTRHTPSMPYADTRKADSDWCARSPQRCTPGSAPHPVPKPTTDWPAQHSRQSRSHGWFRHRR